MGWRYIRISHSEKGILHKTDLDFLDFLYVIFPILNISLLLSWIIEPPKRKEFRKKIRIRISQTFYENFFKIK